MNIRDRSLSSKCKFQALLQELKVVQAFNKVSVLHETSMFITVFTTARH
jgi:hypothetical protein